LSARSNLSPDLSSDPGLAEAEDLGSKADPRFVEALLAAQKTLIIGHANPDGDSLGSAVALALALRSLGREVVLGYSGRLYQHLLFLLESIADYRLFKGEASEFWGFDLLVLVDCPHPDRVWDGFSDLAILPPRLVVDHHPGDPRRSKPVAFLHSSNVSSAGELVFPVISALGVSLTRPMAEALLAAIMSDTGFFSQNNATPECFRQASFLVAAGARSDYVVSRLKRNWTQARVRLLRAALGTLEISLDGLLASMTVDQAMLDEAGATLDDMEGFVEYPRAMNGTEAAAFFRVDGHGRVRVSLRCGLNYSVQELAESLGGGGHRQAAAYSDPESDPIAVRKKFLALAPKFLRRK
jgi:phosphoesterase RecJ-like protein